MSSRPSRRFLGSGFSPAGIAVIYALFGALWIILSDYFLNITVSDPALQRSIELSKGLGFIIVTAGLLYLLLKEWGIHVTGSPQSTLAADGNVHTPRRSILPLVYLLLALLVPLTIGSAYWYRSNDKIDSSYADLRNIAQFKADQISLWLQERSNDAQGLVDDEGFAARLYALMQNKPTPRLNRDILHEFKSLHVSHGFDSILLLDTQGRLLTSLGENTEIPPESLWRKGLVSSSVQFSDLYRETSGGISLDWIVPVTTSDAHRKVFALIVLRAMPVNYLYPMIQEWPTADRSGETLIVRQEDSSVLFLNALRFKPGAALALRDRMDNPDLPAAIALHNDQQGTVEGQDYRGIEVLAAYAPVPGTSWRVIAKVDRGEIMASVYGSLYWIGGITLVAVFMITGSLLLYLRQQQRAQRLALRARSLEAIEQSGERYRTITQSAHDAIISIDAAGAIVEWNNGAEELFGYAEAEVKEQQITALMPERYRAAHRAGLTRIANNGEPRLMGQNLELTGLRKDGSEFPLEISLSQWKAGNDNYYTGIIRDITERKAMALSLAKNAARLHTLVHAIPDPVWHKDEEGVYIGCNSMFARLMGADETDIIGKTDYDFLDKQLADYFRGQDLEIMESRKPSTHEDWLTFAGDGSRGLFEVIKTPLMDDSGKPSGLLGVAHDITARKEAEAKIQRLTRLYAALSQCNEAIVRCASEKELFPKICRAAVEYGGMRMAWIGMVDPASRMVKPVASYGAGTEYLDGIQISIDAGNPWGRGPTGTAIRENQPFWNQDFKNNPATIPWLERRKKYRWESSAALPLSRRGMPVGSLTLYSDTVDAFDEDARTLLTEMATDISFALGNFAYEAQRKNALQEIEFKNTMLQTMQDSSPDAILVVDENGKILFYNQQFIALWPPAAGVVEAGVDAPILQSVVEQAEDPEAFLARVRYLYEHPEETGRDELHLKNGRVIDRYTDSIIGNDGKYYGRVWYFRDITERKRAEQELIDSEQRFRALVEQSLAGIFIIREGELVYVNPRCAEILGQGLETELLGHDPLQFVAESDRDHIGELMRQLLSREKTSVSVEFTAIHRDGSTVNVGANASFTSFQGKPAILGLIQDISEKKRTEERVLNYVTQLQNTFHSTVKMVTSLAEMRDPYTAGHERRVAAIAAAIAQEMKLDEQRIEGIRIAGYLHDIGKVSIPAEILVKPGRLTSTEFSLVQGHAQASYDVLKHVDFPWPVATIAWQHHERLDGSGYPNKLKGDEILLESRIMAVADVVEAMASHRPYRAGLGIDKALAEIERGKGTSYDPDVADACLRLFREQHFELPPY